MPAEPGKVEDEANRLNPLRVLRRDWDPCRCLTFNCGIGDHAKSLYMIGYEMKAVREQLSHKAKY